MTRDRNAFLAGIFMLICAGLIVATIVGIKGATRLAEPSDERTVRFALSDNVGGLNDGDEVRVGGVKVGVVKEVRYESPRAGAGANAREGGAGATPSTSTSTTRAGAGSGAADRAAAVIVTFTLPSRIELRQGAHILIESTVTGTANLNIDSLG